MTQGGGERTGTATVSGACGGLTVRMEGIGNDMAIGLENDVIIFSVVDVILGVDCVIFGMDESMNDEVNGINASEFIVDGVIFDDVGIDEVDANDIDDVITDDVTVDKVTIEDVKDGAVNIVVCGDKLSSNRISEELIVGDVVVTETKEVYVDDKFAGEAIVVSGADDVTFVNAFVDGDTTTIASDDGKGDVCGEDVFSLTKEDTEVHKFAFSVSSISVLELDSPVIVSSLVKSPMFGLRYISSLTVLSGCSFLVHKIF